MTRAILWIGFVLAIVYAVLGNSPIGVGIAVAATVLFMWGCGRYAAGKGYAPALGVVLGVGNVVGLLLVAILPARGQPSRSSWSAGLVTLLLVGVAGIGIVSLAWWTTRDQQRDSQCAYNLAYIAVAMHNYSGRHGAFPPAYSTDAAGKPLLSWRVLILPELGHEALYQKFHLDEPWDSPHNRPLAEQMPAVYACPAAARRAANHTGYLVVTGARSLFDGPKPMPRDIPDLRSATVMVIEADNVAVPWTCPKDLDLRELRGSINAPDSQLSAGHKGFVFAAMADGRVEKLPSSLSAQQIQSLLDPRDGKPDRFPY